LTEDQGHLGLSIKLNDTGLLHFVVQIVTLTGTLADTSEDGVTTVSLGDVVLKAGLIKLNAIRRTKCTHDELLDEHSLADTSTTEETNLTTTGVGSEEIDDLDTSDQDFSRGRLLGEWRRVSVNGSLLGVLYGTAVVDGVTSDVQDTTESSLADRDLDGAASVDGLGTTDETLGTVHGNASHDALSQMLLKHIVSTQPRHYPIHLFL
jgi:hypothetical protein